jgi:outer membrane receptor protein involved in Fe transport
MTRATFPGPGLSTRIIALVFALACALVSTAGSAPTGRIQGKLVATDSGEPIGFADVLLIPADTTMRRVGGLTNADGTFLLEAAPGRYVLQFRALSYATKRIEGITLEVGALLPFSTALSPEAIQQEEIVVEAKAWQNTEASLLSARKKAATVGDAVSAEQVRKTPDKDAAEVLRRVTGISVSDGKYVFVRGLGERYSSTEVDGVRIASPEQNKRVVPLDLVPANLLDNIVVQKTYSADRPGEFGGGDVQVRTKDFPGKRFWSFSVSQGYVDNVTSRSRLTYRSTRADILGLGAESRGIPQIIRDLAGDQLLDNNFPLATRAAVARSFENVWTPTAQKTIPNAGYAVSYGDEFKIFGRPLGTIQSWSLARSFDRRDESARFFGSATDTFYNYAVTRHEESAQLSGMSAFSYRLSPRHTLHARGLYNNSADDEVRTYEGPDYTNQDPLTSTPLHHRATRLMYVQRRVASGSIEATHEIPQLLGLRLNWKIARSDARRQQPDRREVRYDRLSGFGPGGTQVWRWVRGSPGVREFGDANEDGGGASVSAAIPYRIGSLGNGKIVFGYDRQVKDRRNTYRRFDLYGRTGISGTLPPEVAFADSNFHGGNGSGYATETTLPVDNYRATQRVNAGYVSADMPFGRRLRGTFGVRHEDGHQDIRAFVVSDPQFATEEGSHRSSDWLPSANLTWAATDRLNLRLAASRTISRPDLTELSSSPSREYSAGYEVVGNPDLKRALIDNYDVRLEAFPGLSEVLAAGFFYKHLHEPIEQVIQGGTSQNLLVPRNSDWGRNFGVELEARSGLGRIWNGMKNLSLNANASIISSKVHLKERLSAFGSGEHPLQGQATYLVNMGLVYTSRGARLDASILVGAVGKRLTQLAEGPLGDIYAQPSGSLDAALNVRPFGEYRFKLAARNLTDPVIRELHGDHEVTAYRKGRSYSLSINYPS